jgi:AcrR family transcriptional regulator
LTISGAASKFDGMDKITRKQREFKQREARILQLARPILLKEGYQALSMERLAGLMEYAKGTLYNHFPHKEEIVLALAIESMELRYRMMQAASAENACPRERLIAVGAASELFAQAAGHFAVEAWIRNTTIWSKASEERQNLIRQCEARCMGIVAGIARDAIARGDLLLPDGMSAEELVFGFWAITYGSQVLSFSSPSLAALGVNDVTAAIVRHCYTLLSGFEWKPHMDFATHAERMAAASKQLGEQFEAELN